MICYIWAGFKVSISCVKKITEFAQFTVVI